VDPKTLAKLTKPGKVCEPCYKLSGIGTLSVLEKADRGGYRGNPPITSINPRPSAPVSPVSDTLQNLILERDQLKLRIDSSGAGTDFDIGAATRRFEQLNQMIMLRQQEPRRTDRGGRLQ
jgi:hypothetical protein